MDELQEFDHYMAQLTEGLGHADLYAGLRAYRPPQKKRLTDLRLAKRIGPSEPCC